MKEIFALLPFDKKYAISNQGRVINTFSGKELKVNEDNGYYSIQLSTQGKRKNYRVHRLVAQVFLENELNKPYINHKDGNKKNNCVSNLEWVSAKENDVHARETGLKVQNKPIIAENIVSGEKIIFESLSECAKFLNTNKGSIHRALKGKRKKHKNYTFTYLQEYNMVC